MDRSRRRRRLILPVLAFGLLILPVYANWSSPRRDNGPAGNAVSGRDRPLFDAPPLPIVPVTGPGRQPGPLQAHGQPKPQTGPGIRQPSGPPASTPIPFATLSSSIIRSEPLRRLPAVDVPPLDGDLAVGKHDGPELARGEPAGGPTLGSPNGIPLEPPADPDRREPTAADSSPFPLGLPPREPDSVTEPRHKAGEADGMNAGESWPIPPWIAPPWSAPPADRERDIMRRVPAPDDAAELQPDNTQPIEPDMRWPFPVDSPVPSAPTVPETPQTWPTIPETPQTWPTIRANPPQPDSPTSDALEGVNGETGPQAAGEVFPLNEPFLVPVQPPDVVSRQPQVVPRPEDPRNAAVNAAVCRKLDEIASRAEDLASRGAYFAARAEMLMALRIVTQTLDAQSGGNEHSQALAQAMRAVREAGDFVPRGSRLEADLDVARFVIAHRTPVLHGENTKGLLPLQAQQRYLEYAQDQFARSCAGFPPASHVLYGLARVYMVLDQAKLDVQTLSVPTAVVLHQAALLVDPTNHRAANELGVLLARFGQLEDARRVLQQSVAVCPEPEAWHNLSVVHQRLGETTLSLGAIC
ncbi:MAG: hypothetical protein FJ276_20650 [Planctomycetes bacterium]|nr:hypothetical protein [Planctomycetota bacterium]